MVRRSSGLAAGKLLGRYVFMRLAVSFALAFAGMTAVMASATAVQAVYKLKGADPTLAFAYIPLLMVETVPYIVPIAFIVALVATFGRLAQDGEWTAMHMTGLHPGRFVFPAFVGAVLLSGLCYAMLTEISPTWKYKRRTYLFEAKKMAFMSLGGGTTEVALGNFFLSARARYGNRFEQVILCIPLEDYEEDAVVVADSAEISFSDDEKVMRAVLRNARSMYEYHEFFNDTVTVSVALDDLISTSQFQKDRPKYLTNTELRLLADDPDATLADRPLTPEVREQLLYELHRRAALSMGALALLLVGIQVGVAMRRGTLMSAIGAATATGFLYFLLSFEVGKSLVKSGVATPMVAAWTPNLLYFAIGALSWRRIRSGS